MHQLEYRSTTIAARRDTTKLSGTAQVSRVVAGDPTPGIRAITGTCESIEHGFDPRAEHGPAEARCGFQIEDQAAAGVFEIRAVLLSTCVSRAVQTSVRSKNYSRDRPRAVTA